MMKTKFRKRWAIPVASVLILAILSSAAWLLFFKKAAAPGDYSGLSWTQAFDKMYKQLSKEYAFTDWKHIDWNGLHDEYAPQIRKAQKDNDFNAYYITLREFLTEIPDGHVSLNNIKDIDDLYIGGGFGFSAAKLSDGSVIATWVDEAGSAYAAGMRVGAVLTEWNNEPIGDALEHVPTIFAGSSATTENLELKQAQYLTRAPIGTAAEVTFMDSGSDASKTVTLTAFDDGQLSLKKNYPNAVLSDKIRSMYLSIDDPAPVPDAMVETRTLDGNIFYIKLWGELDADLKETGTAPSTLDLFRKAINAANAQQASAIILDIRNNLGGLDEMSAAILGSFYTEKTLYEYQNIYNASTGKREIQPVNGEDALYIEPSDVFFGGRVVCLINQKCVSSGEGIAMGIKNLPNGETMGCYGTSGSFGLAGAEIKMPGGLTVHFPFGQSLDKDHNIQLDGAGGVGGVSPSIRIEMTAERAIRVANGEDVELKEAVNTIQSLNQSAG
jgi:carboxyl-terminal processing protease